MTKGNWRLASWDELIRAYRKGAKANREVNEVARRLHLFEKGRIFTDREVIQIDFVLKSWHQSKNNIALDFLPVKLEVQRRKKLVGALS